MKAWIPLRRRGATPRCPCSDGRRTLRTALLVVVSCNLVLALTKAHRHLVVTPPSEEALFHSGARAQVEPVGFLLSRVSTVAMAYASAAARGRAPEGVLSRARRTWRRPAATMLCLELLATAISSLLWTLSALTRAARGPAAEALFVSASAALALWLGPVLFAHSEIACRLSLVASIDEEDDEYCEGMEALRRAGEVVEGRKVQGFAVAVLLAQLEQTAAMAAGGLVGAALHLIVKFLSCLVYTKFYQDCKKKHGINWEGVVKD